VEFRDSSLCSEKIVEIEEAGLSIVQSCVDVPLSKRVRLDDAAILLPQRMVAATFVQMGERGEVDTWNEMIPYSM
jgi:hypothetical protein